MPAYERRHILKVYAGICPLAIRDAELMCQQIRLEREESHEKALKRDNAKKFYANLLGFTFLRKETTLKP